MDCDVIGVELTGFHFGDLEDEARRRVEAHLLACPLCLQAFLALKRTIETADAKPSDAARSRLRAAVADQVTTRRPSWAWWQRPLAVAVAAAAIMFAASTASMLAASPGGAPHAWPLQDTRLQP